MYIGLSMEAMPTPMPAAKRMNKKTGSEDDKAMPKDETAKIKADTINPGLRPNLSESLPAIRQPAMQPKAREPVKNPSEIGVRLNVCRKKGSAPEITAKSKPNRYPPKADMNDMPRMYLLLCEVVAFAISFK
jgi:hypothetical protein